MERKLDWVPRFDEESKNYPVRGILRRKKRKDVLWVPGPILDQLSEGACVGFGWTAQALATPFVVNLKTLPGRAPKTPQPFARYIYKQAQKIDETPGENYEGTSVLAGAKAMANQQALASYSWAFNIDDVIDALIQKGPVVLGINWYEGMYSAPSGVLKVSGEHVGGHCILAIGYTMSSKALGGVPSITLQNSWGRGWGNNGLAEIAVSDLSKLLLDNGEACIPSKTAYVKKVSLKEKVLSLFR
jgi:hypothetical protein